MNKNYNIGDTVKLISDKRKINSMLAGYVGIISKKIFNSLYIVDGYTVTQEQIACLVNKGEPFDITITNVVTGDTRQILASSFILLNEGKDKECSKVCNMSFNTNNKFGLYDLSKQLENVKSAIYFNFPEFKEYKQAEDIIKLLNVHTENNNSFDDLILLLNKEKNE